MAPVYVCLPSTGELPDVFTTVIQKLPGAKITPLSGRLREQITQCQQFLDKHELRRDVVFITRGTGAFVAQAISKAQPNRIAAIIALDYPYSLLKLPRLLFRDKPLIPTDVAVRTVTSEAAVVEAVHAFERDRSNDTPPTAT